MPSYVLLILAALLASALLGFAAFVVYAAVRYAPIVGRIFEEKPLFLPLRLTPIEGGEEARFRTNDGMDLVGTYLKATTRSRIGVIVFCHEYLSDRWSFQPYAGPLRGLGYDIFTFDFRSHGKSQSDPNYRPLQWVTDHEVNDLRAALAYLQTRPDCDPAGVGLFGISRGGGTALVVAARDPQVWGVISDGAFPTRGTMLAYITRWAEIYVSNPYLWTWMPGWVFRYIAHVGRVGSERRLNTKYPDVEKAVSRLAPRPWFMIHGLKDAYIVPKIAEDLFSRARHPKLSWFVPKAKHNRCRESAPQEYAERVIGFLRNFSPRRELPLEVPASEPAVLETRGVAEPAAQPSLAEVSRG